MKKIAVLSFIILIIAVAILFASDGEKQKSEPPGLSAPVDEFSYDLSDTVNVLIELLSVDGNVLDTLVNERQGPGSYTIYPDLSTYSSGVYFYKLTTTIFYKRIILK